MPNSPLVLLGEPNLFIIPLAMLTLIVWSVWLLCKRKALAASLLAALCAPYLLAWYGLAAIVEANASLPDRTMIVIAVVVGIAGIASIAGAIRLIWNEERISFSTGALLLNAVMAFGITAEYGSGIGVGNTLGVLSNVIYDVWLWILPLGVLAFVVAVIVSALRESSNTARQG